MKRTLLAAVLAATTWASAAAQPYNTDVIATVIGSGNPVVRVDNNGAWTTLASGLRTFGNMVCMANDNSDVVVGFPSSPPELVVIDGTTGLVVNTIHSGAPLPYVDYFNPTGDGDFVVAGNTAIYLVSGSGSGVKTIASGTPFQNLQGICQDIVTGGYVAGDITTDSIYFVSPTGTITQTANLAGMNAFSLTQDHRDGTVYVGNGGAGRLHAVTQGGAIKTLNPALGTNANAIGFDRWTGNGEIVVGGNPLLRVDSSNGTIVKTHANQAGNNTGLCFDHSRNLVALDNGSNRHRVDISIPSQAGKGYVIAASRSGIAPGLPLAGRVIHLVADDVFFLSAQGLLAPYLVNNRGTLDAGGRGFANLDLSSFGSLSGLRLWFAAVTIDANAPGGIGEITKPIVIVLD